MRVIKQFILIKHLVDRSEFGLICWTKKLHVLLSPFVFCIMNSSGELFLYKYSKWFSLARQGVSSNESNCSFRKGFFLKIVATCLFQNGDSQAYCDAAGSSTAALSITERSISILILSLTRTPPASSAIFQFRPQSLRLIVPLALSPARRLL